MKSPSQCPHRHYEGPRGHMCIKEKQNHAVRRGRTEFNPKRGSIPIIKDTVIRRIFCPLDSPLPSCRREETGN